MYVCGFLKLASLSKLIFGKFFLKKNEKLVGSLCVVVEIVGKKLAGSVVVEIVRKKLKRKKTGRLLRMTVAIVEFEKAGIV